MKRCAYCGQENEDTSVHCRECGTEEFLVPTLTEPTNADSVAPKSESPELMPEIPADGESVLCTRCLFPNLPDHYWCKRCGSPIDFGAIVGPVDAARASGFMWRDALQGRPKTFVLLSV